MSTAFPTQSPNQPAESVGHYRLNEISSMIFLRVPSEPMMSFAVALSRSRNELRHDGNCCENKPERLTLATRNPRGHSRDDRSMSTASTNKIRLCEGRSELETRRLHRHWVKIEITNQPVKWQCSRTLGWGTFNLLWDHFLFLGLSWTLGSSEVDFLWPAACNGPTKTKRGRSH
jgi:hypothetical protein